MDLEQKIDKLLIKQRSEISSRKLFTWLLVICSGVCFLSIPEQFAKVPIIMLLLTLGMVLKCMVSIAIRNNKLIPLFVEADESGEYNFPDEEK